MATSGTVAVWCAAGVGGGCSVVRRALAPLAQRQCTRSSSTDQVCLLCFLSLREHKRQDKDYGLWHRAFQLPLPEGEGTGSAATDYLTGVLAQFQSHRAIAYSPTCPTRWYQNVRHHRRRSSCWDYGPSRSCTSRRRAAPTTPVTAAGPAP